MIIIIPPGLKKGDNIGIIAPSSPLSEDKVMKSERAINQMGFKAVMGSSCFQSRGYLSGEDEVRANDVQNMFTDPNIQGIICLRGGYGSLRFVNKLDFQAIAKNPKVFVGYSDITVLHIAFNQLCAFTTFHGPMASELNDTIENESFNILLSWLHNPSQMRALKNTAPSNIKTLITGKACGPVTGGNLALVCATLGTPYEIDTRGKILFLEDIGEQPYRVDRMLTQLFLAGKLHTAEGFILGDWTDCVPEPGKKSLALADVFNDLFLPMQKPTVYNFQAGHGQPNVTIPMGRTISLDTDSGIYVEPEK